MPDRGRRQSDCAYPIQRLSPYMRRAQGKKWVLWQMHIHGTSEHSVDGGYYPMEVHLVHVPAGTNPVEFDPTTVPDSVLVLGVFLVSSRWSRGSLIRAFRPIAVLTRHISYVTRHHHPNRLSANPTPSSRSSRSIRRTSLSPSPRPSTPTSFFPARSRIGQWPVPAKCGYRRP